MTFPTYTAMLFAHLGLLLAIWLAIGTEGSFAHEEGPLEAVALCFLLWAALSLAFLIPPRLWPHYAFLLFALLAMALRELPTEIWVFDERVLTPGFYRASGLGADALAGALYAGFALWSVIAFLRWGLPALLRAAQRRRKWLGFLALAAVALVVSQGSEELVKTGLVAADHATGFLILEELLEAMFALFLCQALFLAWRA